MLDDKQQLEVMSSLVLIAAYLQSLEASLLGNEWLKAQLEESGQREDVKKLGRFMQRSCRCV